MNASRRSFLGRSVAFVATVGAAGVLAACGDDEDTAESGEGTGSGSASGTSDETTTTAAPEPQPLTVMMPFPISINFIADMAAKSAGYMERHGVDLDLQFAPGAPQALQQLAAGNVTVIRQGPVEMVLAVANQDAPFVSIGMPNQRTSYTLISSQDRAVGVADLGGLRAGLPTLGGNAEFTLDLILKSRDVDPGSVERVAVGNDASAYGILQAGEVDVLFLSRSAVGAIRALGEEPHVDFLSDVNPLLGTNLVTTEQFAEERRDIIVNYLAALHETMLDLNDEAKVPELLDAVAADTWDLPLLDDRERAIAATTATVGQWFEEGEENLLRNIPERWEAGVAELVELEYIPAGADATDFYTNDLLDEALA